MRPIHALGFFTAAGLVAAAAAVVVQRRRNGLSGAPSVNVPYVTDIEKATLKNVFYRKVLTTSPHSQLVLMAIRPAGDIGVETHPHTDQFIRIERGTGQAIMNGKTYAIHDGTAVTIPAGTRHNIVNTSTTQPLKLYTIYSPAHHPPGTLQRMRPAND